MLCLRQVDRAGMASGRFSESVTSWTGRAGVVQIGLGGMSRDNDSHGSIGQLDNRTCGVERELQKPLRVFAI